jgi:hypothetical protein
MGDLLGSLIQGSQKRTILCVIGVGCYTYEAIPTIGDLSSLPGVVIRGFHFVLLLMP